MASNLTTRARKSPRVLGEAGQSLTIALASTQREFRGGEVQLSRLAQGLRAAGHRVLAYGRRGAPFVERMAADGFDVCAFAGRGISPLALLELRRRLKRDRPDVLYFNDSHALTSLGIASWGLDIPARVAARRVAFALRSPWQYRALCDRVVASSSAAAELACAGGIPRENLDVVYDGVAAAPPSASRAICRDRLGIARDEVVLLSVAALTAEKGHFVMLAAMPQLIAKHPRLLWLCAGSGALRATLEAEAIQRGLTGHVRFLGQRDDVPDLMAAADLLVMPSRFEGLCSTAIEALHARLPLVSTTAGGLVEVVGIDDALGPVGWMAEPGDADSIASAIERALASPDERQQLVERGQQRAARLFTLERMVDDHLTAFRRAALKRCA